MALSRTDEAAAAEVAQWGGPLAWELREVEWKAGHLWVRLVAQDGQTREGWIGSGSLAAMLLESSPRFDGEKAQ